MRSVRRGWADLGYANVGFHESYVQTPQLDALAADGVILNQYYVQPICSPTRSVLMTGRYTYRLGTQAEIIESFIPFGIPLKVGTMGADRTAWPRVFAR